MVVIDASIWVACPNAPQLLVQLSSATRTLNMSTAACTEGGYGIDGELLPWCCLLPTDCVGPTRCDPCDLVGTVLTQLHASGKLTMVPVGAAVGLQAPHAPLFVNALVHRVQSVCTDHRTAGYTCADRSTPTASILTHSHPEHLRRNSKAYPCWYPCPAPVSRMWQRVPSSCARSTQTPRSWASPLGAYSKIWGCLLQCGNTSRCHSTLPLPPVPPSMGTWRQDHPTHPTHGMGWQGRWAPTECPGVTIYRGACAHPYPAQGCMASLTGND